MKRLANKLYKLQLKGELKVTVLMFDSSRFKSPDDYVQFIRQEMAAHARRQHWYNLSIKMTEKDSVARAMYSHSRRRLHNWLNHLEFGHIDYL